MTFSAVAATGEGGRYDLVGRGGVMMHGPTFMGNPLACAVALASVRLLLATSPWQERIKRIESIMKERLEEARDYPNVRDVRVLGGIGVIETDQYVDCGGVSEALCEGGVWIRPFGHNCYIMPPYMAVSDSQVEKLCDALLKLTREMPCPK